ncbi:C2H2-type domain-containing protein [Mycena kentingensis (nom. inval.)]|nr:C2H2-type domain-containing protein [Mycena kentingensis (nom. inval.)]
MGYTVCYRAPGEVGANIPDNPELDGLFDVVPYMEVDSNGKRRWSDFMSTNFAWKHASQIYDNDPSAKGSIIVPLILSADKTTISNMTGDTEYDGSRIYSVKSFLKDLISDEVVTALSTFLDFCYLICSHNFDESTLAELKRVVSLYHEQRKHSMEDYIPDIKSFGSPYGTCSSITEALSQMLVTNQWLDRLNTACADFVKRGMLPPLFALLPETLSGPNEEPNEQANDGAHVQGNIVLAQTCERIYPHTVHDLAAHIDVPDLPNLLDVYIKDIPPPSIIDDTKSDMDVDTKSIPIDVFHLAVTTFYAPSDHSGIRGMKHEIICCTPSWQKRGPHRNCAFVVEEENKLGFREMSAVRIHPFLSFNINGVVHPCALVEWFKKVGR